jgi:hypothetical protein
MVRSHAVSTVQLRRYRIKPGEMEAFVEWWHGLVPAREQYGFRVIFALVDDSTNEFVWAVSHDGDFDAAEKVYNASPERAAVFAGVPSRVAESFVAKVTVAHAAWD